MKTYILSFFLTLATSILLGQDANNAIEKFGAAYTAKDITLMNSAADEFLKLQPENNWAHIYKSFALILKKDIVKAKQHSLAAHHIYPILDSNYSLQSYIAFMEGNLEEAKQKTYLAFQLKADPNALQSTLDELIMMEELLGKDFSLLKQYAQEADAITTQSPSMIKAYNDCINGWFNGNSCNLNNTLDYFNSFDVKNPTITLNAIYFKGLAHYKNAQWNDARKTLEEFVNHPKASKYASKFALSTAYERLSWYDDYDANRLFLMTRKGLDNLSVITFPTFLKCDLLYRHILAQKALGKEKEVFNLAQQLLSLATKLNYTRRIIEANNTIGIYHINHFSATSASKANHYLGKAYTEAIRFGDKNLESTVAVNYAFALWKQGNKNRAIELTNTAYKQRVSNKQFDDAQNAANNLAFMLFATKDYVNAKRFFQKAVDITEIHINGMNAAQRLTTMNNHSSAYSGLIMTLQKLNDSKTLFQVQDMNRSRLLRTKMKENLSTVELSTVQQNLKDHEVLLYYSEATPGEMIVNIITNASTSIGYNFPVDDWLIIKKQFINLVNKQPNSINGYLTKLDEEIIDGVVYKHKDKANAFKSTDYEKFVSLSRELLQSNEVSMRALQSKFLKHWYTFLIQPIEAKIEGKKTLIISGEGSLNTIPFEAFIDNNNKYLIERFNIKYIPSATIWNYISNRNYSHDRASLLAMGGATYQEPNKSSGTVRTIDHFYEYQDAITQKIKTNTSNLSTELKGLGFGGANYLPGTLKEVENLKALIPDATILINEEMKESDIKKLNLSGKLSKYKWLHIATHGFASNTIPELSGVMMTQPKHGDGKEDMFLLAHEIEKLNLKADMAVLSACETALGKSYNGEGINGLNSALMIAGANSTLLSLWPVNDAGTMIFMTEVYNNLHNNNMSVEEAINSAKRIMLSGERYGEAYRTPVIWAPFVLNGK